MAKYVSRPIIGPTERPVTKALSISVRSLERYPSRKSYTIMKIRMRRIGMVTLRRNM